MMQNFPRAWIVLAGMLLSLAAAPADKPGASISRLSWLSGCWESSRGERRSEEQWMKPGGRTMLGMSRTVSGSRTSEFEYMQIREDEGRLVFIAQPSGQSEASFPSIDLTDSKVVFENKAHDFPQRIIYRLNEDGSLAARIEGQQGGESRGIDFPMRRMKCPGRD